MKPQSLSVQEVRILNLTADLWNLITELDGHHPCDLDDHARDVHGIQQRVMARLARRTHPALFTRSK